MGDNVSDEYNDAAKKVPPYMPMSELYRHVNPKDTETLERLGLMVISFDEFIKNK